MKLKTTLRTNVLITLVFLLAGLATAKQSAAQVSIACTNPNAIIYGLTSNGEILGINVANGATTVVKNGTYAGNDASKSNGMGYNYVNKKFYYFKRNVGSGSQEFVSFEPSTNTVTLLAPSTCTSDVHTGSVNYAGTGYYTIDTDGNLSYYNIRTNTWKLITNKIVDQFGADVDKVIRDQDAGDMAMDGWGAIWLVTSSNSNYGLYKFNAPLPTNRVESITVNRIIAPTAATPTGESFAGISFSAGGQLYMTTRNDNKLFRLNTNFTLSFLANLGTSDAGNDLTSCNFPFLVLPLGWKSFEATVQNSNKINLGWEVMEDNSKGFYVQHSIDGKIWEDLTFIASTSKANGTLETYTYSYISTVKGNQYYRIKQIGQDGKENYSDVRTLLIKNINQVVSIWPNPATDQVRILNEGTGNNAYTKARIFDLSGRMLVEKQLQPVGITAMNISQLPAGTYIVKVEDGNGVAYNQKISKQ